MSERKKILELFEKQKEFMEEKVATGIERYRKGYGHITIKDENSEKIQGAKIEIKQKNHEFRFGANLFMLDEMETEEKNEKYKEYFAGLFNMATLPFYWNATEPEKGKTRYDKDSPKLYRRPAIDLCIEFCQKHGIEPREHALAYERFFPNWLYDASVAEIKMALEKRYSEISERYKDKIPTIEVTNEVEWLKGKTAFYDERDFVEWCFKLAEKYFPANQLVVNEHTSAAWADSCRATDKYYAYTEAAMLKGARIDAIGMQYHMFFRAEDEYDRTRPFYNPENLYRHMDLYAGLGKPLQVTEITIPAYSWDEEDEKLQAQIIEYLYKIWFSHPSVEQIVYWNLVDGYAHVWEPAPEKIRESIGDMTLGENYYHGGLLRFDLSPKPAYYTIKNLIEKEWHTETSTVTDAEGEATFKGFYGDYEVTVTSGEKTVTKTVKLTSKGRNEFQIQL